jgi:hypothetical protein
VFLAGEILIEPVGLHPGNGGLSNGNRTFGRVNFSKRFIESSFSGNHFLYAAVCDALRG